LDLDRPLVAPSAGAQQLELYEIQSANFNKAGLVSPSPNTAGTSMDCTKEAAPLFRKLARYFVGEAVYWGRVNPIVGD
jgi:hypothetical protein